MLTQAKTQPQVLRVAGVISILVALIAVAADEIIQYWPQGYASMAFNQSIPLWRLSIGHVMGVLAIPLCLVGYWCVCQALRLGGARYTSLLFWISAYTLVMGTISHDAISISFVAFHYGGGPALMPVINYIQSFANILGLIFLLGYLLSSAWYSVAVLARHSLYPHWMALCNPFLLSLLIALLYASGLVPAIMNVLWPAWLSTAHAIFFALSAAVLWSR